MENIPSNRGGSKLCYQGYMYTKHATRKTNQWWKCVKRSSIGCRGNLSTTLQNENPVPGQPHNHAPSDTSIKYSKTRNAMKDLATNTRDKPSHIFAQVVSQCDDNVQALLPREENPKRTIRYQRPTPPVPATYADVRLPEEYTTTTNSSCNTTTARMQKTECLSSTHQRVWKDQPMPRPSSSSWTVPSLYLRTHLNSYTPSGFHSKM